MRRFRGLALALALIGTASAARAEDEEARRSAILDQAFADIQAQEPGDGLAKAQQLIDLYKADYAKETRRIYCAMSGAETLAYMGMALGDKVNAIAISSQFCQAQFVKEFALFDLGRMLEARATLETLLTYAPMHAHYWSELGHTYRIDRNWPVMLEKCSSALGYAELAGDGEVKGEKGLAMRCMGYAQIELGKWDEAEKLYRQCLALDPNDAKAKSELDYIAQQRAKRAGT